jgi:hypothetical protein
MGVDYFPCDFCGDITNDAGDYLPIDIGSVEIRLCCDCEQYEVNTGSLTIKDGEYIPTSKFVDSYILSLKTDRTTNEDKLDIAYGFKCEMMCKERVRKYKRKRVEAKKEKKTDDDVDEPVEKQQKTSE